MANVFYVYEHWRLDKDECFYVGKGRGRRAYARWGRNTHWKNIVQKIESSGFGYEVRLVATGLTEDEAFALEKNRISFWREIVDLANKTDGGDGVSGLVMTEEARKKMSERAKGRPGVKSMLGKKHSEATRKKMSAAHSGKPKSPEHAAKVGAARRGKTFSHTPETRYKMSSQRRGKNMSDLAKANMRAAWVLRKQKELRSVE